MNGEKAERKKGNKRKAKGTDLPRTEDLKALHESAETRGVFEAVKSPWRVRHEFVRLWDGPRRSIFATRLVKFDRAAVFFDLERNAGRISAVCFDEGALRIDILGKGYVCDQRTWGAAMWEKKRMKREAGRWRGLAFNESVQVRAFARRRGVATALYDLVDTITAGGTVPCRSLTGDGKAFWEERECFRMGGETQSRGVRENRRSAKGA